MKGLLKIWKLRVKDLRNCLFDVWVWMDEAILDLPDEIHFPQTPANLVYTKNVMLRNLGRRPAKFAFQVNGFFAVSPVCGDVEPENFLEVYVQFRPPLVGVHEGELIVAYNHNIERMYCKLYGVGLEVSANQNNTQNIIIIIIIIIILIIIIIIIIILIIIIIIKIILKCEG